MPKVIIDADVITQLLLINVIDIITIRVHEIIIIEIVITSTLHEIPIIIIIIIIILLVF